MYLILTNAQLDLASSFSRFQMAKYGNVLLQPPTIAKTDTMDDGTDDTSQADRVAEHYELELIEEGD